MGFEESMLADNVYTRGQGENMVTLGLYVDDIIMISPNQKAIEAVAKAIHQKFATDGARPVEKYLGLSISQSENRDKVQISAREYIEDMCVEAGLDTRKEVHIPIHPDFHLQEEGRELTIKETLMYQSGIGNVRHLETTARLDVCNAIRILSQRVSQPTVKCQQALDKLMCYLWTHRAKTIAYDATLPGCNKVSSLCAFADASFKSEAEQQKSVLGFVVMFMGGPVIWKSKKIATVNSSAADAEIVALAPASRNVISLRLLINELGYKFNGPTVIYEDNKAVRNIIGGNKSYDGEPYLRKKVDVLKEHFDELTLALREVNTDSQLADGFTKSFTREKHGDMMSKLGMSRDLAPGEF